MASCSVCNGTHWVSCSNCLCKTCTGRGGEICSDCRGRKSIKCLTCEGTGKVRSKGFLGLSMDKLCQNCDGKGSLSCPVCKGKGLIPCSDCNGSGHIGGCQICGSKGKSPCPECEKIYIEMLMKMEEKSFKEALDVIESWGVERYANQVVNAAGNLFNISQKMGAKSSYPTEAELIKMLETKTIPKSPWFSGGVSRAHEVLAGVNRDPAALEFLQSNGQRGGGRSGCIGGSEAKKFIIFCLKEALDGGIRRWAALCLGAVGEKEALASLIEALGDSDIYVIKAAARALGAIADKRAIDPLKAVCNSGLPIGVREAAGEAIMRIRQASRWP